MKLKCIYGEAVHNANSIVKPLFDSFFQMVFRHLLLSPKDLHMASVLEKTAIFKIFSLKKSESQANNIFSRILLSPISFAMVQYIVIIQSSFRKRSFTVLSATRLRLFFIFPSCWEKNILFVINLVCRVAFAFEVFPPCNGCRSYFRPCVSCL